MDLLIGCIVTEGTVCIETEAVMYHDGRVIFAQSSIMYDATSIRLDCNAIVFSCDCRASISGTEYQGHT